MKRIKVYRCHECEGCTDCRIRALFRAAFRGKRKGSMAKGVSDGIDRGLSALAEGGYLKREGE